MRLLTCIAALAIANGIVEAARHSGRSLQHVGKKDIYARKARRPSPMKQTHHKRQDTFQYLTNSTSKYSVDGSKIPDLHFDVGESYAGLMPISKAANESSQLYFWFFPSKNQAASDEILIWLNGGPGCSSLEGLMQENGPFLWQHGTFAPVPNPYSWTNLTNVVWIEQPVGTGFSQGTPTATSEEDVAQQFLGFWENFMDTFNMKGRKVFISGESYAGQYIPYIADAMLNKKDTTYFNLEATMIYDPSISHNVVLEDIPAVAFTDNLKGLFPFNNTFAQKIHDLSNSCGYTDFLNKYLTFPPPGPFPASLPGTGPDGITTKEECATFGIIFQETLNINPCFDIYQVATTCPLLWDVLGFPGSIDYVPEGASVYFNRSDVQQAINAPQIKWNVCNDGIFKDNKDQSPPSALTVLPGVIERSKRTIIGHGALDMVLMANGTLLAIQNMTWNGMQGFQTKPADPFFVPYHNDFSLASMASAGIMGVTHTERNLTWVYVELAGHMVPQYTPASAYRHLEFLLGRVDSLSSMVPFTTQPDVPQPQAPQPMPALGNNSIRMLI